MQKLNLNYKGVEFFCCLIPLILLLFQMVPSLYLLWKARVYRLNRVLTVKVIAHQWY